MISSPGTSWFAVRKELPPRAGKLLTFLSFFIPLALWCLVSYVPVFWHPNMTVQDVGDTYFEEGQNVKKADFFEENERQRARDAEPATGRPSNPIYLPAPEEVVTAFYQAFTTPPRLSDDLWLHESLWMSIKVIFIAFTLSSLFGIPLGILCGTFDFFRKLHEPFIEFFRYLPAPTFGALAVAILGIYQAPKIAIVVIGTFFQQVLVISSTTRKLDLSLLEAAQTLGATRFQLLTQVVVPGILPDLHRDQRILLGWAWTYLIVAEVVGTSTGITWFINQQAKYRIFDNVFAAIFMIGILGLVSDWFLLELGKVMFPWKGERANPVFRAVASLFRPTKAPEPVVQA
jgi:NitT/TauT family transport system permease protein